jgi:hypothetical protein
MHLKGPFFKQNSPVPPKKTCIHPSLLVGDTICTDKTCKTDLTVCPAGGSVRQIGLWSGQSCGALLVLGPASECWHPQNTRFGHWIIREQLKASEQGLLIDLRR